MTCVVSRYDAMTKCWNVTPSRRPSFAQISRLIEHHLSNEMGYLQLDTLADSKEEHNYPHNGVEAEMT